MMLARIPIEQRALKKAWTDAGMTCFCCRDSGLVIDYIAARYLVAGYQRDDVPILCKRPNCEARYAWLDTPAGSRKTERYSCTVLDTRVSAEMCERVHQAELSRIRDAQEMPQEGRDRIRQALTHPKLF
ncbi:MAG: hypothetical protein HC890_12560 [Chloroflexaceae bacterium]|nr:hypothetical protein [Chloroflexaceae bacterium]